MAPKLSAIGGVFIGGESAFGVEADYFDALRVASIDITGLERITLANEFTKQGDHETARILGGSRGTFTTTHRMHGWSSTIPTSTPALADVTADVATAFDQFMAILASAFGNMFAGGYAGTQTVSKTGTPTDTLTSTLLTSFRAGQAITWATGTTRRAYETGWIKAVDTSGTPDTATLLQVPKHDPQGATVWGAYTAFVRDLSPFHDDGACKSFSVKWQGGDSTDVRTMYGCQPIGLKFTWAINQVPVVEITWGVAHWLGVDDGGPPAVQTWSYPEPEACNDWQIMIGTGADDDVIYPVTKEVTFELGLTRNPLEGGHSSSGVEGWFSAMRRPKLTLTVLTDALHNTAFSDQAAQPVTVQVGSQPGRIMALCLPAARLISLPKRGDRDGATVMDLEFEAHYYDGDTGSTMTHPLDSLARLAFV